MRIFRLTIRKKLYAPFHSMQSNAAMQQTKLLLMQTTIGMKTKRL